MSYVYILDNYSQFCGKTVLPDRPLLLPKFKCDLFIYVPGNNDIGGEGGDPVTAEKSKRFQQSFPNRTNFFFQWNDNKVVQRYELEKQDEEDSHPHVEIVPANVLTFKSTQEDWFDVTDKLHANVEFRLVVSHMPILATPNQSFGKKVMKRLSPNLIFSAHDHKGRHFFTSKTRSHGQQSKDKVTFFTHTDKEFSIRVSSQDDLIHEIIVPTSNYRMGVREMAYGLAVINFEDNTLTYVNVWLPSRFPLLFVYLALLCIALTLYKQKMRILYKNILKGNCNQKYV